MSATVAMDLPCLCFEKLFGNLLTDSGALHCNLNTQIWAWYYCIEHFPMNAKLHLNCRCSYTALWGIIDKKVSSGTTSLLHTVQ